MAKTFRSNHPLAYKNGAHLTVQEFDPYDRVLTITVPGCQIHLRTTQVSQLIECLNQRLAKIRKQSTN